MSQPETESDASPALRLEGVGRDLANGTSLLADAELTLPRGGLLVLVGPSGAGKTTLLRLVNRLDEPTRGKVTVLGRPLRDWPVRELRRRAALVFQEGNMLGLTVRENLLLPFTYRDDPPGDLEDKLVTALAEFGLKADLLNRGEDELSVGQKQRVCLARALIGGPEILLLDEPTASLDPPSAHKVLEGLLTRIRRDKLTVVLSTHRMDEAHMLGGRMAVLQDGRILALDDTVKLLDDPPAGPVAEFLAELTTEPLDNGNGAEPGAEDA